MQNSSCSRYPVSVQYRVVTLILPTVFITKRHRVRSPLNYSQSALIFSLVLIFSLILLLSFVFFFSVFLALSIRFL
jgi:hypothetical protein